MFFFFLILLGEIKKNVASGKIFVYICRLCVYVSFSYFFLSMVWYNACGVCMSRESKRMRVWKMVDISIEHTFIWLIYLFSHYFRQTITECGDSLTATTAEVWCIDGGGVWCSCHHHSTNHHHHNHHVNPKSTRNEKWIESQSSRNILVFADFPY